MGRLPGNRYVSGNRRAGQLKVGRRLLRVFGEAETLTVVNYRPGRRREKRGHTTPCVPADAGIRINESLTLRKADVDSGSLPVKAVGEG